MREQAVLIAAVDLLPSLKARLDGEARELLAFADVEALRALEVITTRRPGLVLLEQRFAATPRGAALINRIKADPSLTETEIRVTAPDGSRQPLPAPAPTPPPAKKSAAPKAAEAPADAAPPAPKPELDFRGTRRSPRHRIADNREILVDGKLGTLVDLSACGAQLVTATILKPNQRVRVTLTDEERSIRCSATVVWASFEIPKGSSPRYRCGLDFIEPNSGAIDAYIRRHRQS